MSCSNFPGYEKTVYPLEDGRQLELRERRRTESTKFMRRMEKIRIEGLEVSDVRVHVGQPPSRSVRSRGALSRRRSSRSRSWCPSRLAAAALATPAHLHSHTILTSIWKLG
jgi:hypothetical protein